MEKYKTLISLRFKTHKVNENDEFIPPAITDETKVFCINGDSLEDLKKKMEKLCEEVGRWLRQ